MLELLAAAGTPGDAMIIDQMAGDDLVRSLLLLHGLHPLDLETRGDPGAGERPAPTCATHGGNVELVGVADDGVVRLRLQGSCNGCASSAMTLKTAIEEAIYEHAPDVVTIDVEGVVEETPTPGRHRRFRSRRAVVSPQGGGGFLSTER